MEETIQKNLLHDFVLDLEQKLTNSTITPDDFKTALYQMKDAKYKIQSLIGLLQENDNGFKPLFRSVANESYADLVDDLNSLGYRYKKQNTDLRDAFKKMGYRIMEQTRAGKRDDVFYSILRIFMSMNIPFDRKLLMAFKNPNIEMFKILIFSFLSGIIEEQTNQE